MTNHDLDDEIVRYQSGDAKLDELQPALTDGWRDILGDPELRSKAAKALGVSVEDLSKAPAPPVAIKGDRAGFTGPEIVIEIALWISTEVVLAAFKDLAKEELKKRIKQLWSGVLEPVVRGHLRDPRHGLGPRTEKKKK